MQVMKWSALALAVTAGSTQLAFASAQSESKGFVEDASLNVLTRSAYFNRDYKNHANDNVGWGLGFIGKFESGFTEGTVGFGVDAFGLVGLKLDGGAGTAYDSNMGGLFPAETSVNSKNRHAPQDDWSQAGGAVKVRISNTVLKYGNQMPSLPVLAYDDSRLLPESFTGFLVNSKEIEGLELNAGHFTQNSSMYSAASDDVGLKSIDLLGGSYAITDTLSVALYASDVEDKYKKKYANANYTIPLSEEQALNFDFNIYRTKYDRDFTGASSTEDNTIWSLAGKFSTGPHAFILAYQQNSGDRGYSYGSGDGGYAIYVANSFYSDFNAKDEKSVQVSYEVDFGAFGVPGLTYKTAYIYGYDADYGGSSDGKEREFFNQAKYVIQDGAAKDLSFKLRSSIYRASTGFSGDMNEIRAFVEYPLSIL